MSFINFLRHLGEGKVRKAFMGSRGTWSDNGTTRNLSTPWDNLPSYKLKKRSWLGQRKNNIGKFMFGTRKNNGSRTWLGRRKNNVETLLQKIPWFGKRVSRSRNNASMSA